MFIYRDKATRTIAIDRPALNAFLKEEGFEDAFLRDLGIFLLPVEEKDEEEYLLDRSPVSNIVMLYTTGVSQEDLGRILLEQIRQCALEETQSLWSGKSFHGAEEVEDWKEDVKQFGEKARACHFLSLSTVVQPVKEWDDFFGNQDQMQAIPQRPVNPLLYLLIAVVATFLFFQRIFHR